MKKYHIVYKTVNMINSKFYIGKHSTDCLEDGYLGSGLLIRAAIELYGRENFKREILFNESSSEVASVKEREMVTEDLLKNPQCYNIALGGTGGNLGEEINQRIGKKMSALLSGIPKTEKHKQALREVWKKKCYEVPYEIRDKIKRTLIETWATMGADERKLKCGHPGKSNGFFGKTHTEKSIQQMKLKLPNRKGSNNPNAKKVIINGITYSTLNECREKLQISKRKLYKLIGETQ